jgi:hypothetical protein
MASAERDSFQTPRPCPRELNRFQRGGLRTVPTAPSFPATVETYSQQRRHALNSRIMAELQGGAFPNRWAEGAQNSLDPLASSAKRPSVDGSQPLLELLRDLRGCVSRFPPGLEGTRRDPRPPGLKQDTRDR